MKLNKLDSKLKKQYLKSLRRKGYNINTVKKYSDVIDKFYKILNHKTILLSNDEEIILFRDSICQLQDKNGLRYSITSIKLYLNFANRFLFWLSNQKGFKYIAKTNFKEILKLTKKLQKEYKSYVSEKNKPISEMEFYKLYSGVIKNPLELRTKCMLVMLAYCAPRNGALRTLRIRDVSFEDEVIRIVQNPKTCDTKFGKNIQSFLILPTETMYNDFVEYVSQLKNAGFTPNDPLFGKLKPIKDSEGNFNSNLSEITKEFYKSNSGINTIIKNLCKEAKLESSHTVHSFRHYYALYIKPYIKSASELESVASSLGHQSIELLLGRPYGRQTLEQNLENMIKIQKRVRQQHNENGTSAISRIEQLAENLPSDASSLIKALLLLYNNNKSSECKAWN